MKNSVQNVELRRRIQQMSKCEKCGFENRVENNYCAKCGAPLTLDTTKPISKPEVSNQMKMAAGAIAVVVIFSIIAGAIWWNSMMSFPGMSTADFEIRIECDTSWAGSIGGGTSQRSIEGSGSETWTVTSTMAVAVIQKQTDWGTLTVRILKNSRVVAQQTTTAAYGVVTVSATS
jgi:ribosomal protein L37E